MDLINFLYTVKQDEVKKNESIKFLGHCLSLCNESTSQNFQDVWALYESGFKRDGFYVEFGATDGVDGSNTYLLSKDYNWKGILAEPNPVWHTSLKQNRDDENTDISFDCVYTETNKTLDFLAVDDACLTTIQGFGDDDEHRMKRKENSLISVKTVSLVDLLDRHSAPYIIDYISVDTEGSEYDILESFFSANESYDVRTFTVEHNFNVEFRDRIYQLMMKNGYERKFIEFSRWDDFYFKV
jgi:FkbM family methyltransferase